MSAHDGIARSFRVTKPPREALSAARLVAVQALYEIDITDAPADPVLQEFLAGRWRMAGPEDDESPNGSRMTPPDKPLMSDLVGGVRGMWPSLDEVIGRHLSGRHTVDGLETLVRNVLRAGIFELRERLDIPARVVIGEYVDLGRAFFEGREPALINAVLDKAARDLRPGELPEDGRTDAGAA